MSRSVAGFTLFLYVCVVSGQQSAIRLKGTPTDPSFTIGVISGGNYPDGSFSIGHGDDNENGDAGHGADHGLKPGQSNPNYNNGHVYPSLPNTGQNGGPYINGQNDIRGYGGQNNQNSADNYEAPPQNPGPKPTIPYEYDSKNLSKNPPVKNSASRLGLFSKYLSFIVGWFY